VYDLRAISNLGKVTAWTPNCGWGRANFFAAMPYKIGAPQIALSTATATPGQPITATIAVDVPAQSAESSVYVEIIDPR